MRRLILPFCLAAGLADAVSGVLLVLAPSLALTLMGVAERPAEPVYLRWIGVFVACVGALYLLPWLGDGGRRAERLRAVFEATVLVRGAVAVFVAVCLARGLLGRPWISVALTDAVFAAVQIVLLRSWHDD